MKLSELIELVNGFSINDYKDIKIKNFCLDSRHLKKGDVFIALKGDKYDAHNFISDSLKASAIISEKDIKLEKIPVIKVKSTYQALERIISYKRSIYKNKVIALTGSNGKTTTKELLYQVLSKKYKVLKNDGNNNNLVGVFKTIMNLDSNYDMAIFELGMNHLNEIKIMSSALKPDIAIITNIGSSHIGNLGSKKNIFKAKSEITTGLNGPLVINGDDTYLKKLKGYHCGVNGNNDLIAYNIHLYDTYLTFNIALDREYLIKFNKPIKDYIPMLLEVIKIGLICNVEMEDIIDALNNYKAYDKRLNEIKCNNYIVLDDSYNASYESVKCGLEYLKKVKNEKIIILGDMLELGKYSKKYHLKINHLLNDIDSAKVLTVGNYTKYIFSKHFKNNDELINYLRALDLSNKYIYVKGSNRMHLDEIVKHLIK